MSNPTDRPATEPRTAYAIVRQALRMTGMTEAQADARISALLAEAAQGAAPRAEGLDVEALRIMLRQIEAYHPIQEEPGSMWHSARCGGCSRFLGRVEYPCPTMIVVEAILTALSRPSDERPHHHIHSLPICDENCPAFSRPSDERVPESEETR